jgi:hypothetical protein
MSWVVRPEPDEAEWRSALLRVVERTLAEDDAGSPAHASHWWRSGLEDLGDGTAPDRPWRQAGVGALTTSRRQAPPTRS